MAVPPDPAAFVAAAERGINERDLDVTAGVYAPDAVLTAITDGALQRHEGAGAVRRAWAGYLDGMDTRQFWLRKTLSAASGDTIANEWVGGFGVGGNVRSAQGAERWRFDADGRVVDHIMWTFLSVHPAESLRARARIALDSPRTALAFLRAERRHAG